MYSNNIQNFQESTTILNAITKKSGNLLKAPRNLASYPARVEGLGKYMHHQQITAFFFLYFIIYFFVMKISSI